MRLTAHTPYMVDSAKPYQLSAVRERAKETARSQKAHAAYMRRVYGGMSIEGSGYRDDDPHWD